MMHFNEFSSEMCRPLVCHLYLYVMNRYIQKGSSVAEEFSPYSTIDFRTISTNSECMKLSMLARQLSWEISEMSSRCSIRHIHIRFYDDDIAFTFELHRSHCRIYIVWVHHCTSINLMTQTYNIYDPSMNLITNNTEFCSQSLGLPSPPIHHTYTFKL